MVAASPVLFNSPPSEEDTAAKFGLSIVWFEGHDRCGLLLEASGCYRPSTPDVIYVESGLMPAVSRSIVLHEIGHAMQFRAGRPQDECGADRIARELGATWFGYDC